MSKIIARSIQNKKTSKEVLLNKPIKLSGKKIDSLPKIKDAIVEIDNLKLSYKLSENDQLKLVIRNTSLHVKKGETIAIIGESGSGKSVLTSAIYGLAGENAIFEEGTIKIKGQEVQNFSFKDWEKSKLRGKVVSAIFQNPMTTLNPTMKIGKQIMEGILINKRVQDKKEAYSKAIEYLTKTKIPNPEKVMNMYPHQLSGGMKQRVVISAIVACQPEIIIMDEPTTALDPNVQAEVLKIIYELQKELNLTVIFITHDLGVVSSIADRIAIMYAGQIIEIGSKEEIMWNSAHPYTWGLLSSMPDVNHNDVLLTIKGSVPNNLNNIKGDAFAPRNDFAMGIDFEQEPPFYKLSETHFVKSWLYDEKADKVNVPNLIRERWKKYNSKIKAKENNAKK